MCFPFCFILGIDPSSAFAVASNSSNALFPQPGAWTRIHTLCANLDLIHCSSTSLPV